MVISDNKIFDEHVQNTVVMVMTIKCVLPPKLKDVQEPFQTPYDN